MLLFPILEPVDCNEGDPGTHWTLGVLYCHDRQVVYYDSYQGSLGFPIFKRVHHCGDEVNFEVEDGVLLSMEHRH